MVNLSDKYTSSILYHLSILYQRNDGNFHKLFPAICCWAAQWSHYKYYINLNLPIKPLDQVIGWIWSSLVGLYNVSSYSQPFLKKNVVGPPSDHTTSITWFYPLLRPNQAIQWSTHRIGWLDEYKVPLLGSIMSCLSQNKSYNSLTNLASHAHKVRPGC